MSASLARARPANAGRWGTPARRRPPASRTARPGGLLWPWSRRDPLVCGHAGSPSCGDPWHPIQDPSLQQRIAKPGWLHSLDPHAYAIRQRICERAKARDKAVDDIRPAEVALINRVLDPGSGFNDPCIRKHAHRHTDQRIVRSHGIEENLHASLRAQGQHRRCRKDLQLSVLISLQKLLQRFNRHRSEPAQPLEDEIPRRPGFANSSSTRSTSRLAMFAKSSTAPTRDSRSCEASNSKATADSVLKSLTGALSRYRGSQARTKSHPEWSFTIILEFPPTESRQSGGHLLPRSALTR